MALLSLIVMRQNISVAITLSYMTTPFMMAAPLCAIYGMCVGHVKHGLLLLAAMSLMIGLFYWVTFGASQAAAMRGLQQMLEQQRRQFPGFPH